MAITASDLIAALTKLSPSAEIYFGPDQGSPLPIEGGIPASHDGKPTIILAPLSLADVGGF